MDKDLLKRVCDHLGIDESQALKVREEGDEIVIVMDMDISGCPKVRFDKSELEEPKQEHEKPPARKPTRRTSRGGKNATGSK